MVPNPDRNDENGRLASKVGAKVLGTIDFKRACSLFETRCSLNFLPLTCGLHTVKRKGRNFSRSFIYYFIYVPLDIWYIPDV